MPEEETPSAQPLTQPPVQPPTQPAPGKKQSKWRKKIPKEILNSPGGMILILAASVMELIDLIPIPFLDQLWELPLEIIFIILLVNVAKLPFQSLIIPFLIERIPGISDIVPTWLLRIFV